MANDHEPTTFEEAFERYIEYRTRFERLENDFDEYQQSSLNYEQELEVQLKQLDSQSHRLQQELFVERTQNEQYRERSEQTIKQFDKRLDQLQEELNACKNLNEKLTIYIRELEQTNDDLERSKRTLLDSLSTFETQLNRALEQNALLENELDEKQQLTETVQRLRDETRDLREELDVLHKTNTEKTMNAMNAPVKGTPIVNSSRMKSILSEAAASGTTPTHDSTYRQGLSNGHHKVPSSLHGYKNGVTTPSTPKPPSLSSVTDFNRNTIPGSPSLSTEQPITTNINSPNGYTTTLPNDFTQPLSIPTRLQSLNLINEAFRRFSAIEATLAAQRKQSQMTSSSISSHRSRMNPTGNNSTTKQQQQQNNESTMAQAQS
ncbi:unnamed protein product [Rotaria magnacalcarata]|uniref:NUDE domain-containing protein n=1 Tax=Rotaria magnacalcarata TaxID=392030 RepID=A0A815XNY3_9BILA|nr:unnamed protein product [Rotaria magnacalcarata]CAF1559777.1 unnamed protein product [Rotaria magnacalcarata]CAF2037650.1 unnamed protein product [Rotaria magnacalcarata]CAF2077054.1 unnamed protein product [Rotaria magnacalcarata]CAF3754800.1 unnamed protein product [Rotaria magnacalcarata]